MMMVCRYLAGRFSLLVFGVCVCARVFALIFFRVLLCTGDITLFCVCSCVVCGVFARMLRDAWRAEGVRGCASVCVCVCARAGVRCVELGIGKKERQKPELLFF